VEHRILRRELDGLPVSLGRVRKFFAAIKGIAQLGMKVGDLGSETSRLPVFRDRFFMIVRRLENSA
jgi:hypothetical protein